MLRALLVDSGTAWRGGQRQTALLAGALHDRGIDVHIASPLIEVPGTTTTRWSSGSDLSLRAALRLARLRPSSPAFDIVHAMDGRAHAALRLARVFGLSAPLVVTRHVTRVPQSRLKYRGVDRYIAVSPAVRDALSQVVSPGLITVIPPAVPSPRGKGNRGSGVIVTVAALTSEKGVDRVIRLAAHAQRTGLAARWLIVGDGPDRVALERLALELNAPVTFTGWREDVGAILCSADLMLHLPRAEGFGLSVVEALACGVPVVAADVGGLREFVAPDVGSLVDPDNSAAVLAQVRRWLADPSIRAIAADRGPRIAATFSIARMTDATLSIYAQALGACRTSEQTSTTFSTSPTFSTSL